MTKMNIQINHSMEMPEGNFEEINKDMVNLPVLETQEQLYKMLTADSILTNERNNFMNKIKDSLKEFDEKHNLIKNSLKEFKEKALQFAEETKIISEKVDIKTGEIIKKIKTKLPSGIGYIKGKTSYVFKEDKMDDKFFKKTLKKTMAKKAIATGELPYDTVEISEGNPSISLTRTNMDIHKENYKFPDEK